MRDTPLAGHRFKDLAFLREFSAEYLDRLATVAAPVHWRGDEVIYREGDVGSVLYMIDTGRVAIEVPVPGRGRITLLTVGPGEVLGWSSLFHDRPKDAAARSVAETHAWALDAGRLRALCDDDPQFGYAFTRRLLREVSERLKATRVQLLDLFAHPVPAATHTRGGR